jgi:hypothetical protein
VDLLPCLEIGRGFLVVPITATYPLITVLLAAHPAGKPHRFGSSGRG